MLNALLTRLHSNGNILRIPAPGSSALRVAVALLVLWLPNSVFATTTTQPRSIWMSVTLDGRKVGHLQYQRSVENNNVITNSTLDIGLARTHKPLDIRNQVRQTETLQGMPLSFGASTRMSGMDSSVQAVREHDGQFQVKTTLGGRTHSYTMNWPPHSVLDNGLRKEIVQHGFHPGTQYTVRSFDTSSQSASSLQMKVIGPEHVELPDGAHQLIHLQQVRTGPRTTFVKDIWVDRRGDILKSRFPFLGFTMELLACSRQCALAPNQDLDILGKAIVDVPRPLPKALLSMPVRYIFQTDGARSSPFAETDMQVVRRYGHDVWVVDSVRARRRSEPPPIPSDTQATDWLQSDDPELHALAVHATQGARNDSQRMAKLTHFVHRYMHQEGANVAYASALEALKTRHGDCTEYAVLLAAMARSLQIPARVATGLVYSSHYSGRNRVLAPHTWVHAWVDNVWRGYDAMLAGGYDHSHIALAIGDGDPWKYFSGLSSLGSIHLLRVTPAANVGQFGPPMRDVTPHANNPNQEGGP